MKRLSTLNWKRYGVAVLWDLWCKKSRDEDSKWVSYASLVTEPQGVEGAHRKHLSIWCPGQRGDWVFVRWRGVELTAKTVPYLLRKDNVWQVNKTAESCWLLGWIIEVKMTSFWFKTSCHLYPPIFFSSLMKKNNVVTHPAHWVSLCIVYACMLLGSVIKSAHLIFAVFSSWQYEVIDWIPVHLQDKTIMSLPLERNGREGEKTI